MKTNYGDGLLLQSTEWIDCTVCEGLDGSTSGLEREQSELIVLCVKVLMAVRQASRENGLLICLMLMTTTRSASSSSQPGKKSL